MGCGASARPNAPAAVPESQEDGEKEVKVESESWAWSRTILDRFAVQGTDVLGIGNFSVVRRGRDESTGQVVAVKCLKSTSCAKFRREVFLFDALMASGDRDEASPESPRGVEISATVALGTWEYRKTAAGARVTPQDLFVQFLAHSDLDAGVEEHWSVLELGDFTLHDFILACGDAARAKKRHSLQNEEQLNRVLVHVTAALAFLHSRCFIHGDMKPANIMWFGQRARWKLIDMDGLRTPSELVDMRDAEFYTAIYAAPELARAVANDGPLRLSRHLDVWSVGLSLMELKLLRPIFESKLEAFSTANDGGLAEFFRWLGFSADPLEDIRSLCEESQALKLVSGKMLELNPLERVSPVQLMQEPLLQKRFEGLARPVLVEEEVPSARLKPKSAWQLFQEEHRAEVIEQGFAGPKTVQELHRRWKELQSQGGPELQSLQAREAEMRAAAEKDSE